MVYFIDFIAAYVQMTAFSYDDKLKLTKQFRIINLRQMTDIQSYRDNYFYYTDF